MLNNMNSDLKCIILTEPKEILHTDILNRTGYKILYNHSKFNDNDWVVVFIKYTVEMGYDIIKIFSHMEVIKGKFKICNKCNALITRLYRFSGFHVQEFVNNLHVTLERTNINNCLIINIDLLKNDRYNNKRLTS